MTDCLISQWLPSCLNNAQGKVALVTGANAGLGLETTKALLQVSE